MTSSGDEFVYAAWSIDLRRFGAFVRPSAARGGVIDLLRAAQTDLTGIGARGVRVLESTVVPPLPGTPPFDLTLLANGEHLDSGAVGQVLDHAGLLRFDPNDRYMVMNYAGIPGPVPRFLADQLLRPSFYRTVTRPLAAIGARPCPIFARRVS